MRPDLSWLVAFPVKKEGCMRAVNVGKKLGLKVGGAYCGSCNSKRETKSLADGLYIAPCLKCGSRGVALEVGRLVKHRT